MHFNSSAPNQPPAFGSSEVLVRLASLVQAGPDVIALWEQGRTVTRAGLLDTVQRAAGALSALPTSQAPVALMLPDGTAYLTAMLSLLAAGRFFLPMDRTMPFAARQSVLRAAQVERIIVAADDCDEARALGGEPIVWELCEAAEKLPIAPSDPFAPAIIFATSGSSGRPKLLVFSAAILMVNFASRTAQFKSSHADTHEIFLSLGAPNTGSLQRRLQAIFQGVTLVIASLGRDGVRVVLESMIGAKVTGLRGPAGVIRSLLAHPSAPLAFAALRNLIVSSEGLLRRDLTAILSQIPDGCRVFHGLSCTEAVGIAFWQIDPTAEDDKVLVSVGPPDAGVEVMLIDESGQPVIDGGEGELVVTSERVALGEWIDGRLISDRFTPDPTNPSRRTYRTGDLARIAPSGRLVFLGRRERMVKINGRRVEPVMTEAAMTEVPGVAAASVQAVTDGASSHLIGFVVPSAAGRLDLDALRRNLLASLPPGHVPGLILELDALPLLPNGKVDRAALLATATARQPPHTIGAAIIPKTGSLAERQVVKAWTRILGAVPSAEMTFHAAGGDSLRFLELIVALEVGTGRKLDLQQFHADMNVAELAAALTAEPAAREATGLFFLPGAWGELPPQAALRRQLGGASPVELIDWPNWRVLAQQRFIAAEMIARALEHIRRVTPTGPISLIGYSLGGRIVAACAQALEQEGRRSVRHLIAIDTVVAGASTEGTGWQRPRVAWQWRAELEQFITPLPGQSRTEHAAQIAAWVISRQFMRPMLARLARSHGTMGWSQHFGFFGYWLTTHLRRELCVQASQQSRGHLLQCGRLSAPVVLLRCDGHSSDMPEDLGWAQLCSDLTVRRVAGNHTTMISDTTNRDALAQIIHAVLENDVR